MDLGGYIQNELTGILKQVEATPPKRHSSLQRIRRLVESAGLQQKQKKCITHSIEKIEDAIKKYTTPRKTTKKRQQSPIMSHLHVQAYMDQRTIREILKKKTQRHQTKERSVLQLQARYNEVRKQRESLQEYLRQLVAMVQRLERLKQSRSKYQEKVRASSAIDQQLIKRMRKMKTGGGNSLWKSLYR